MNEMLQVLFLSFVLIASGTYAQSELNLIQEKQRYGFINQMGEKVIPTQFLYASSFKEGTAVVRSEKGYGYIDTSGEIVIPPRFDHAESFQNGIARVFIEQQPYFIDHTGHILFETKYYETVQYFLNNRAIVKTHSNKYGAINRKGELIIDTIFSKIEPFKAPVTRAYGLNHNPTGRKKELPEKQESTLIDTNGNILFPYHLNYSINGLKNNHFTVKIPEKDGSNSEGVIDSSGKLLLKIPKESGMWNTKVRSDHLIEVIFRKKYDPKTKTFSEPVENARGFINYNGDVLFYLEGVAYIRDFHQNRSFISMKNSPYKVIDRHFNILPFDDFRIYRYIDDSTCFAQVQRFGEWNWIYIDTLGQEIDYTPDSLQQRFDEVAIYGKELAYSEGKMDDIYFLLDKNGQILSDTFSSYNRQGFYGNLLLCEWDDKQFYLNKRGIKVWETPVDSAAYPSNIDFKMRARFYASSAEHWSDIGGFGSSKNASKPLNRTTSIKGVFIEVDTTRQPYGNALYHSVHLINSSSQPYYFSAQDSRLYMVIQAQDEHGEWRDIEYIPSSWCGNSYHTLTLKPQEFWEFRIPVFDGSLATTCRIKLTDFGSEKNRTMELYSPEFTAHINPTQFWKKHGYIPNGIMDPYID